jgi:hypothetical protein
MEDPNVFEKLLFRIQSDTEACTMLSQMRNPSTDDSERYRNSGRGRDHSNTAVQPRFVGRNKRSALRRTTKRKHQIFSVLSQA